MPLNKPDGFMESPVGREGPGVVVLHPWWGLNDTIKAACTRRAGRWNSIAIPERDTGSLKRM
jgi:dienelactone hydrolase